MGLFDTEKLTKFKFGLFFRGIYFFNEVFQIYAIYANRCSPWCPYKICLQNCVFKGNGSKELTRHIVEPSNDMISF